MLSGENITLEQHVLRGLAILSIATTCLSQPSLAQQCDHMQIDKDTVSVAVAASNFPDLGFLDSRLEVVSTEFQADLPPDAIVLTAPLLGTLIKNGAVISLDSHIDSFELILPGSQFLRFGGTAYALPLFATSRVWVVRKDVVDDLGFDLSALDVFEFLEQARWRFDVLGEGNVLGLDYGDSNAVAADFLSVFNGIDAALLTFVGDAGHHAFDAIEYLTDFADYRAETTEEVMNEYAAGHYVAISVWADDVDRYLDRITEAGHSVIIAPPVLFPGQRPSTQLSWTGVAFTGSLEVEEMWLVYCSLQAALAQIDREVPGRFPLRWTQDGLAWSRGGEGVISSLGRGASFAPADPEFSSLQAYLGRLASEAIVEGHISSEEMLNELDAMLNQIIDDSDRSGCFWDQSCFRQIPQSEVWRKTVGGGTCSTAACSSGQYCCNGECQNTPCNK